MADALYVISVIGKRIIYASVQRLLSFDVDTAGVGATKNVEIESESLTTYSILNSVLTRTYEGLVHMLIPKWLQTPLMVTGSPQMQNISSPSPFPYGDSPYGYGDCVFGHPFSHALKNIFFAEASHTHRANILHMISRIHIDASLLYHLGIILQSPFHYCVTSVSGYLSTA
jgi:hypothetical protein